MTACALVALAVGCMYALAVAITYGDGVGSGLEIPREISLVALAVFLVAAILGGGAWIVDRSAKDSVQRDVQPLIRDEVELAFTTMVPELAAVVAERVSVRTGALVREVTTGEIAEIVTAGIKRAYRAGALAQAQLTGNVGVAKVVKMRLRDED